jgi:hypothetical protein
MRTAASFNVSDFGMNHVFILLWSTVRPGLIMTPSPTCVSGRHGRTPVKEDKRIPLFFFFSGEFSRRRQKAQSRIVHTPSGSLDHAALCKIVPTRIRS